MTNDTKRRGKRTHPDSLSVGDQLGRWNIKGPYVRQEDGQARFPCQCTCGTERDVLYRVLREVVKGLRPDASCGCLQREYAVKPRPIRHGSTDGPTRDSPDYQRARRLWTTYRLTWPEYLRMLTAQSNRCKICRVEFGETTETKPHVDHNHASGKVRGILCVGCNYGIGNFRENVESMKNAILYLESYACPGTRLDRSV